MNAGSAFAQGSVYFRVVFFGLLSIHLYFLGALAQPAVHSFYDEIVVRDSGTIWHLLTWSIKDEKYFLPVTALRHLEGPLQFFLLNAYYHLVGDLFPLNPATTQFPNTILTLLGAIFAYLVGRRIDSEQFGYLSAMVFALMPWVAPTIRRPELFNTLSVLLEVATLYVYVGFVIEPRRRLYRIAAPLTLALYLTTGLDWPSFLFALVLFLILSRRLTAAVRNPANIFPVAVVTVYLAWTAALVYYGQYISVRHAHLYQETLLARPFIKVGSVARFPSFTTIVGYATDTFGVALPLAIIGLLVYFFLPERGERPPDRNRALLRPYLASMVVWMAVFAFPLFKASSSITYGYVLAVPVATLAATSLSRARLVYVVLVATVLAGSQWHLVTRDSAFGIDDRRVLAAATLLIEQRPDLLREDKVAFLPRNAASNVGQYARGRNERIIMPNDFPAEKYLHSAGSREDVLLDFVNTYQQQGKIKADWLIISSENVAERSKAAQFYLNLLSDPQVSWIAAFMESDGKALWLGEVKPGGPRVGEVKVYAVGPLADRYIEKYDRIDFLKRNVKHVIHTFP